MNEVHIIAIIVSIFVVIGALIPFVNQAFNENSTDIDFDGFQDDLSGGATDDINAGDVALSIFKMFFWTFGDIPIWLDLVFTILRIVLIVAVVKILPFT